jgi:plastocyanin
MVMTLWAGAFITSQREATPQSAAATEVQPSPVPDASAPAAALMNTTGDLTAADQPAPVASPSPEPQPQAAEPAPVRWTSARRAAASPPPAPSDVPKPQPAAATPIVQITDSGFVPDQITIKAGEAVLWTNDGSRVHTATALTGAPRFDTGGLATHQTAKVSFATPGTFTYSSATDCLNGNHDPGFTCGKYFAITVTG